jgi:hypothetical protein
MYTHTHGTGIAVRVWITYLTRDNGVPACSINTKGHASAVKPKPTHWTACVISLMVPRTVISCVYVRVCVCVCLFANAMMNCMYMRRHVDTQRVFTRVLRLSACVGLNDIHIGKYLYNMGMAAMMGSIHTIRAFPTLIWMYNRRHVCKYTGHLANGV